MIIVKHLQQDGSFLDVAEVTSQDLEFAFCKTQNLQDSWSIKDDGYLDNDDAVFVLAPLHVVNGKTYGLRSTSMGDRMTINGRTFEVAMMGFKQVEN